MQYSKTCLFLLGLVCAGALFARLEGIQWPKLHPDEPVIGHWLERSPDSIYIKDRVYPNGFFALARPFVFTGRALIRLHERFAYYCGAIDRMRSARPDGIYFGRWFNALAGTLLCVVMFLLVARITRSQWAGLFAAALIGFAQYAVEHSHYAETDLAAILTLTIALWLWVMAGDTVRRCWFIAAALASGFAAGTKFTLLALVPLVVIEAILFARAREIKVTYRNFKKVGTDSLVRPSEQQKRGGTGCPTLPSEQGNDCCLWRTNLWRQVLKLIGLVIFLFGAGFVIANPAVLLDFKWFWTGLAAEKQRVFAETALNLGPLVIAPTVRYLHHSICLHDHLQTLGYPWIVLIAVGLPCVAVGFARRYWTSLFLFPVIYAAYWLFMAPWVRSQEFLLFLPSFAALAALPLAVLWRAKNYVLRIFALVIALLAIAANGYQGLQVAALFGWKDTRLMAREWLQIRLPPESALAVESYAEAACIDTWKSPLSINKIERYGIASLLEQGADYLLRTAGISGRGLRHPLTGELYPEPAQLWWQFLEKSELLSSWAPLPPRGLATFVSPAIELYGLKHFTPTTSLQIALSQPALIINADQNAVGRQTFFPTGRGLGCAVCLLIDRFPQTIAVGGPESLDKPVFLVLSTAERQAVINIRGFGMEKKVALEPYDTCLVPLQRPAWQPRAWPFEKVALQAEPVKDILYIPCFARIVFTVDEAARLFMETGREDRLNNYFSEELLEKELNPGTAYVLAARLGLWSLANKIGQRAAAMQTEIGKCLQADPASVSINGNSGYYYEQFARARLQQPYDFACLSPAGRYGRQILPDAIKVLDMQLPQDGEGSAGLEQNGEEPKYSQRLALPVLFGRGQYELRGELMLKLKGAETDLCVPLIVRTMQAAGADCTMELQSGTWRGFSLVFRAERESQPQLDFCAPDAALLYLKNMEIRWSLSDVLEPLQTDLAMAAIRHSIHQADLEKAAAQLAVLPEETQAIHQLEIRQMKFMCAGGLQDDLERRPWPSSGRQTARRLLELAPNHYQALLTLTAEDEAAGKMARQMDGNLKNPPLFTPWLALVGFSFNAETREARCVFEALRNDTPGLAATFWLERRSKWRRKQVQSLTAGLSGIALTTTEARLGKGERCVIVVRLNEAFSQTSDLNKLALGIETDVLWHAGAIPLATGGYVVPFSRLNE